MSSKKRANLEKATIAFLLTIAANAWMHHTQIGNQAQANTLETTVVNNGEYLNLSSSENVGTLATMQINLP